MQPRMKDEASPEGNRSGCCSSSIDVESLIEINISECLKLLKLSLPHSIRKEKERGEEEEEDKETETKNETERTNFPGDIFERKRYERYFQVFY